MQKRIKKVLSFIIISALMFTVISVSGFAAPDDLLSYEVVGDGVVITGCDKSVSGKMSIPSEIDGLPVRGIDDFVFFFCSGITSVIIPDTVTDIGRNVFFGCTALADITIPDSVVNIGYEAFENTAYYNNVANWDNNVLYIGKHIVSAKRGNEALSGDYTVKNGTKTIAYGAFTRCFGLTGVSIPESVINIGETAFAHCTALKRINVDVNNKNYASDKYGVLYNKDKTQLIQFPAGSELTSFTVPDGVSEICGYSFVVSKDLKEISFPDSVTDIGYSAFEECTSLTASVLPEGLNVIGSRAFANCTALTEVTLPESLASVGNEAFIGCIWLKNVKIAAGVTEIGDYAFGYDSSYEMIHGFKVFCVKYTEGERYADENSFDFELYAVLGDVNSDDDINSSDALLTLQHTTGLRFLETEQMVLADVTSDGTVNSSDALKILQFATGIISDF